MQTANDLFAGAGGFSTGAALAGVKVQWAANHCPTAVDCHARNHTGTIHSCQDLHQADFTLAPRPDWVLASPCCQGFTPARGKDRPHHDASRSTAWAVISCLEAHQPKGFIVENVPEFLDWRLFPSWKQAVETLGYHLTTNVLDAADAGVPQHRVRLFVVGSLAGPISIPRPSKPHVAIASVIDWSAGNWSPVNKPGRAEKTLLRVANGRREFGRRFVMPYYQSGSGLTGRSLDRPLGTVTCKDRWAVVDGDRMRMLSVDEYRQAMGFPVGYWLPKRRDLAIRLLGNAVPPPLAAYVVENVIAA